MNSLRARYFPASQRQTISKEKSRLRRRESQRQTISKEKSRLRAAGVALCLLCAVYMAYVSAAERAVAELRTSEAKAMIIAGVIAVTEGEIVRADERCTIIRYYYEWDGTYYKRVIPHVNADYPVNTKLPVVYSLGMGIGSCLTVGFYRKAMLMTGVAGMILLIVGMGLNFRKRGNG